MTIKRYFAVLCFILPCALAQAGTSRESVPLPTPAIGDSWTYQYTDVWKGAKGNINRVEVAAIDEAGVHVDVRRAASGALLTQQLFSPEMNPVDRGAMHFAPSFARYAFPLAPGKEWSSDVTGNNPKQGKNWRYHIKGKVLDWEKVKVPAGEFEALKIVVEATYGAEDTFTKNGSGQLTETVWFVPELNNFVKLDYRDTDWQGRLYNRDSWELTTYVRKQ
ncbi:hypothetical protein GTP46_10770 [Duganella sp. FT135W]|uniref:DUF3108 domain-containing protein n=1 Tax=Duganella flavida TaxID=2692175 RepID=A0A6L8K940_9BURK|nr:DUF3108 domain-containing protein [Duganella flavida]MYM23127.1 hypothetical protein [Duganella flavida]